MRLSPVCAVSSADAHYEDVTGPPVEFKNDSPLTYTHSSAISMASKVYEIHLLAGFQYVNLLPILA